LNNISINHKNKDKNRFQICEICGVFQATDDADDRIARHFEGKQHKGFDVIRQKVKELEELHAMEEKDDKKEKETDHSRNNHEHSSSKHRHSRSTKSSRHRHNGSSNHKSSSRRRHGQSKSRSRSRSRHAHSNNRKHSRSHSYKKDHIGDDNHRSSRS